MLARLALSSSHLRLLTKLRSSAAYSNITYSGGHASEGQGGFYGSGGARILQNEQTQREGAGE